MKATLPLAALAMFFITPVVFADCPPAEQAALEKFDRDWGDAGQAGDAAALGRILADDFRDLTPGDGLNKAESIAATMKSNADNKANPNPAKAMPDHYLIQCSANSATITHRTAFSGKDADGKSWTDYRRSIHVLEKRGGQWQVVSTLGSPLGDGDTLRYLELDWSAADLRGDASWLEQNLADDFSGVSNRTGKMSTKSEEIADMKAGTMKYTMAETSNLGVRRHGDVAVVTGHYHYAGTNAKGEAVDRKIAFTDTWKKEDDRWLVWASQGTLITE
ncbi:MAG TPA: nuclear transport factor 2 family protein [Patescibacteria group bacterium]|nr:nuclear transport factor 2 family protein [Patescibacteria group bacterium]